MTQQTEFKAVFWNIGEKLDKVKLDLLSEAIIAETPDIFCIAEGSKSKAKCNEIIDVFAKNSYSCYYSPLFSTDKKLKLGYRFQKLGLKVFIRNYTITKGPFSFAEQREKGRIIVLKVFFDSEPITFIFLHNKSKAGAIDETLDQIDFVANLKAMISVGKIADEKDRVIIIGDFNLEPWDRVLKHKKFLSTSFFQNHNTTKQRNSKTDKHFFNPVVELMTKSATVNLGGTYYSDNIGWALLDYALYDTNDGQISYDIITEFKNGSKLLNSDTKIKKAFLNHGLDHLPIVTKITTTSKN